MFVTLFFRSSFLNLTPMGMVIRCSSCDTALIRVAQVKGRYLLDMRGVRVLQISAET